MTLQNRANDIDPKMLNALKWRCIGPPRGGRVVAVAGDPADPAHSISARARAESGRLMTVEHTGRMCRTGISRRHRLGR